ncbi:MAG: hypothetical protein D6713_02650, partial [Deltaproteobacteria bacterium]
VQASSASPLFDGAKKLVSQSEDFLSRILELSAKAVENKGFSKKFEKEMARLNSLPGDRVDEEFLAVLRQKLKVSPQESNDELESKFLSYLAEKQGISGIPEEDMRDYCVARCIVSLFESAEGFLADLSDEKRRNLDAYFHRACEGLTEEEMKVLKEFTGVDKLTSKTALELFRKMFIIGGGQALVSSAGFGPYLFLTTFLKSVSLMVGTTFSFAVYAAAASALSFVLSPFFLAGVLTLYAARRGKKSSEDATFNILSMYVALGALYAYSNSGGEEETSG